MRLKLLARLLGGRRGVIATYMLYLGAASIGALLAVLVRWEYSHSVGRAVETYRLESTQRSKDVAARIESTFRDMYQGLRTIARLPGVRTIDRYAQTFDDDARGATQEIYNDLASNVALSEVYIVPLDMQPDEIDPRTGRPQEPITTFDHLIIGRTRDDAVGTDKENHAAHEEDDVEEIEIFEYRLMRRQLDWFAARYPQESAINGLDYPAICGHEVITCDNTRYSPAHPDDHDRMGIVYSVPFFGNDGALRGSISGVMLTGAVRDLLHGADFAIRAPENELTILPKKAGVAHDAAERVAAGEPDDSLLYSDVIPIRVSDSSRWLVWAGRPDSDFWSRADVVAAGTTAATGYIASGGLSIGLMLLVRLIERNIRMARTRQSELERLVRERTQELKGALDAADTASRAKSEFLANMSHEIRTPMTAIIGYADLLLDPNQSPADRVDCVQTIRRNGEHLLTIINDILDISKIEAGKMTVERIECSPIQIMEQVYSLMHVRAQAKGLELKTEYNFPVPERIVSDPTRLSQILINLVSNAVKFTERGRVTVRTGFDDGPEPSMFFEVTDTGIGMNPEQLARLFRPFTQADTSTTRRFGGTGLGLTISKSLAELLGGGITVTTEEQKGTTFTVRVPTGQIDRTRMRTALRLSAAREPTAPAGFAPPLLNCRILLAEDGPDNRRLITFHLGKAGAVVDTAENGRIAVDKALAAEESGQGFDIVLMDMQMPEMDGYSAAAVLRMKRYSAPIIALTAHAMAGDREKCLAAGCDGYLTKPIDAATLVKTCLQARARRIAQPEETRESAA